MIPPELIGPRPAGLGGVILAGGGARRFGGGDKGRRMVAGRSILDRQIAVLAPQVAELALNANGPAERFAESGLAVRPDSPGTAGPLAGLLAGLDWAAGRGLTRLLTVPCDLPFVPRDLALRLAAGAGGGAAVAASAGRVHPVIGLWPVGRRDALRRFLAETGERRAMAWVERCGAAVVDWPEDPFLNVNDPAGLAAAEAWAAAPPSWPAAILLPAGATAQDLLTDAVALARARDLRVGGLLQQGRRGEAVLVALDDGERLPIMQKLGRSDSCAVDGGAVAEACRVVRRAVARGDDLVVVNKFGPLEAERSGLADEMMAAMAGGQRLLTTVTLDRVAAWLAFTGGLCTLLPADPAVVRAWLEG